METDKTTIYLTKKLQEAEAAGDDIQRDKYYQLLLAKYNDLIYFIVKKFDIPPRVGVDDVVSVAKLGLWKGFKRFDPSISKATTYLTKVIKGEIYRYYRDYCWQWKVARRLKEAVSSSKDVEEISKKYNISTEEVIEIQNILRSNLSHEDYQEFHEDVDEQAFEKTHNDIIVEQMLSTLGEIESEVIKLFYIEERGITDIADICCIEVAAVKKILTKAVEKLKEEFENEKEENK